MREDITAKTFTARLNLMPGAGNTLAVTGTLEYTTSGWKAELVEAVPQGINPAILILDLIETEPSGPVSEVLTEVPVRFPKTDAAQYRQVTIRQGKNSVTIDVEIVH